MTGAAQARGLRRARKLRALRLLTARPPLTPGAPPTDDELRRTWLDWGGLDAVVATHGARRPGAHR